MARTTTLTENRDIDYIAKDFTSVTDALISYATVNYGTNTSANRLWTDFNADSFSRNWLEIVAFVSDLLFFYLDNQATQTYLQTATVRSAVLDIAKQFGFSPATSSSASGVATFTVSGAGTITRGSTVLSNTGVQYFTTTDIIFTSGGEVNGTVLQGTNIVDTFSAEGLQSEEFNLSDDEIIKDLDNIINADVSPQVSVNGNSYTLVNSFLRHNGSDTAAITDSLGNVIGGGGRVFTLNERADDTPFLKFGDGVFGKKLSPGDSIIVNYRAGGGSSGNISLGALNTLGNISIVGAGTVDAVDNSADFSGGADEQSIERLRDLIPASLSTLERAVTQQDYSDILITNFTEVFDASTEDNTSTAAVDLNIYVIPQGSGITNITDNPTLLNQLTNFIDRRKMVTVQFDIKDAFGIAFLFSVEVTISDSTSRGVVESEIQTALVNYFNLETGGIDGGGVSFAETIRLTDISNLISDIDGVERFEITRHTYRPRVDENIVSLASSYQNSGVTIFSNVTKSEWLLAASGVQTEAAGGVLFDNTAPTEFTYTSGTGVLAYNFPVDLSLVAAGDIFTDSALADFAILGVDTVNSELILQTGLTVDTTVPNASTKGACKNGATSFESFKCFKKTLGVATNISADSITDNDLDLSVASGTGASLSDRELIDNTQVFVPGEFATGSFYLVDSTNNIWEIIENDSNTLTMSITAVNDAAITVVAAGDYSIVKKLASENIVFNDNIFGIQFNNLNTIFSIAAQFDQIGTINDPFEISEEQTNIGKLGVPLDLVSHDAGTGVIVLNANPNLSGITTSYVVIDSGGQTFNVTGTNNSAQPIISYPIVNKSNSFLLEGTGLGSQVAQGFKVTSTDDYPVVSFNLQKEGNITGNLTARIVNDSAGLPNLASIVASSNSLSINNLSSTSFDEVAFTFATPPNLSAATQYHLVLSPDASYASSESSSSKTFDNSGAETFSYSISTGDLVYDGPVDLSAVLPGHFFQDYDNNLFEIILVDDAADTLTLADGLNVEDTTPNTGDGSVIKNDRVLVATDNTSAAYSDGEFARYDGASWSNSVSGPSQFTDPADYTGGAGIDAVFKVQGSKTITVESNLVPELGPGATVSERYYDDENQISLALGISSSVIVSATDANDIGKGTVGGTANSNIDNFIFRSSEFSDDVTNIRLNEVPEISTDDIAIKIFGGVD